VLLSDPHRLQVSPELSVTPDESGGVSHAIFVPPETSVTWISVPLATVFVIAVVADGPAVALASL
jgi:hypothetical protein